jgi:hypothetical protein
MFKKITLASAAAAAALTALPGTAEARHHDYYNQGYAYNNGYNGYSNNGYYGRGYNNGYYNRNYSNRHYYGRRCSGTTGTIVGGVAGALLGRSVTRDYRHSGTTGTILGGALGALAGRAIGKDSCRY